MVWSYYGSKSKLVSLYPPPRYGRIVEPFAGSARYAAAYPDNEVTLLELDPTVYRLWYWLIHEASDESLASLPVMTYQSDLRKFTQLTTEERLFLGFSVGRGRQSPGWVVTRRADPSSWPEGDARRRPQPDSVLLVKRARYLLPRIRHWKIFNCSYANWKINYEATWFIDPPYKGPAGRHYVYSRIDYAHLSEFCKSRKGLVIVCEGDQGDWLPFTDLSTSHRGSLKSLREKVWVKDEATA